MFARQQSMGKKARQCTAACCTNTTEKRRPFCASCFSSLNIGLRDDLIKAWKSGSGKDLIRFTQAARKIFEQRKDKVADKERNEKIEISAEMKQDREKSWMVFDGRMKDFNGKQQEDWICLPKKLCTQINENTFEVPYWLAKQHGLI